MADVEKRLRSHRAEEKRAAKKSRATGSNSDDTIRVDQSVRDIAFRVLRQYRDSLSLHDLAALVLFEIVGFSGFKKRLAMALRRDGRFTRAGHGRYIRVTHKTIG
jgi:hypothetical protein